MNFYISKYTFWTNEHQLWFLDIRLNIGDFSQIFGNYIFSTNGILVWVGNIANNSNIVNLKKSHPSGEVSGEDDGTTQLGTPTTPTTATEHYSTVLYCTLLLYSTVLYCSIVFLTSCYTYTPNLVTIRGVVSA